MSFYRNNYLKKIKYFQFQNAAACRANFHIDQKEACGSLLLFLTQAFSLVKHFQDFLL